MTGRMEAIQYLTVGDIFNASSPNGAKLTCLVTGVTPNVIEARTVTTQLQLEFDRSTGVADWGPDRVPCTIDGTRPLPPDIHSLMLQIDHKFGSERDPEKLKLTPDEMRALVYLHDHYPVDPYGAVY